MIVWELLPPIGTSPKLIVLGLAVSEKVPPPKDWVLAAMPPPQEESMHTTAKQPTRVASAPSTKEKVLGFFAKR